MYTSSSHLTRYLSFSLNDQHRFILVRKEYYLFNINHIQMTFSNEGRVNSVQVN